MNKTQAVHAAEIAIQWSARRVDNHGSKQLLLLDARAAFGGIAKGRSSSWAFLRILRRVTTLSFATGIEWIPRWIRSAEMPADEASRHFALASRRPVHPGRGFRFGEAKNPESYRPLRGAHLKPATVRRYLHAFLFGFLPWAASSGTGARVVSAATLDSALGDWI